MARKQAGVGPINTGIAEKEREKIAERMQVHEKTAWMLRALLEK